MTNARMTRNFVFRRESCIGSDGQTSRCVNAPVESKGRPCDIPNLREDRL